MASRTSLVLIVRMGESIRIFLIEAGASRLVAQSLPNPLTKHDGYVSTVWCTSISRSDR